MICSNVERMTVVVEVLGPGGVGGDERQADLRLGHRATARPWPSRPPRTAAAAPAGPCAGRCRCSRWNSSARWSTSRRSKSSPPRWRVAGGGAHLDHAVADVEDAHVERAAAEVEDQHGLVLLLVQAVGERGGGRLVDDAQHLEAGDPAGVLGRRALGVVEVRRHGDDGLGHLLAEELRRVVGELAQHLRADLLRRVQLAPDVEADRAVRARRPRRRRPPSPRSETSSNRRPMNRLAE